jgi:6-pyruvoyltetrahydropterin/6-carboxytetrahydropterin synthase
MFELKVTDHFAAAHKLKMVATKCENLHGHNWKVEACVRGKRLNNAGVLMDFGELKQHLSCIMERLDHKYLNELECFKGCNSSSENIAVYIAEVLQALLDETETGRKAEDSPRVSRITVWESENACASYIVEEQRKKS